MTYRSDEFDTLARYDERSSGVPFAEVFSAVDFVGKGIAEVMLAAFGLAKTAVSAVVRQYQINQTIRQLSTLDDHRLEDIGIDRASIERAALAAAGQTR